MIVVTTEKCEHSLSSLIPEIVRATNDVRVPVTVISNVRRYVVKDSVDGRSTKMDAVSSQHNESKRGKMYESSPSPNVTVAPSMDKALELSLAVSLIVIKCGPASREV